MAETAEQRLRNVLAQEAERQTALQMLASLRQEAASEIDRLIAFLDASDEYASAELEDEVEDDGEGDSEASLGWTEREAARGRYGSTGIVDAELDRADDEPSLAALERHPSAYGSGRDSTGDQENWAGGTRDDREDEHDGAEPDEGDAEPSLGWTDAEAAAGSYENLSDYEGPEDDLEPSNHTREVDIAAARERYSPVAAAEAAGLVWQNGRVVPPSTAKALRELQTKLRDL